MWWERIETIKLKAISLLHSVVVHVCINCVGGGLAFIKAISVSALQPSEDDQLSAQRTKLKRSSVWYLASWNVRNLLDTTGSIETARQRCDLSDAEDRKID